MLLGLQLGHQHGRLLAIEDFEVEDGLELAKHAVVADHGQLVDQKLVDLCFARRRLALHRNQVAHRHVNVGEVLLLGLVALL